MRIAITGLGCVSAFGLGVPVFWSGLASGRPAIRETCLQVGELQFTGLAGTVPDYRAEDHFPVEQRLMLDPFAQYAVLAAREAADDAGLPRQAGGDDRTAVILGTGSAGEATREAAAIRLYQDRRSRVPPTLIPSTNAQAAAGAVCADLGLTGPALTVSTGCAAASHAIGLGLLLLRQGLADRAIVGGAEASIVYGVCKAFESLRVLSSGLCRPFSRDRDGTVMGEGAGIVVLERWDTMRRHARNCYAELSGFGMSSDATHLIQPTIAGPTSAIRLALADAGFGARDVGYINAHGTGTIANDSVETAAIKAALGGHATEVAISSTKPMHGHAIGATGGLELIATALALYHGLLPPTLNYLGADGDCDLDYIVEGPRSARITGALSHSFAFGGSNAVLALRAWR